MLCAHTVRRLKPDAFFEKPISLAKLTVWLNGDR